MEDKAIEEEDALERIELANLRRTGGRASPLWSQMPEFAGLTRALQKAAPASNAPSPAISALVVAAAAEKAATAIDSPTRIEEMSHPSGPAAAPSPPPRSPSPWLAPSSTAAPQPDRPKRKRNTERYDEAKEALVSKRRRIN